MVEVKTTLWAVLSNLTTIGIDGVLTPSVGTLMNGPTLPCCNRIIFASSHRNSALAVSFNFNKRVGGDDASTVALHKILPPSPLLDTYPTHFPSGEKRTRMAPSEFSTNTARSLSRNRKKTELPRTLSG